MADTMEPIAPSTPSPGPSSKIRTPTAPQHGYSDSYEPYSPRKSSRIAQRATNRTPSPQPPRHRASHQTEGSMASPKSTKKRFISSMATPAISPQKKRMPPIDSSRRASGTLTAEATAHAAVALGLSPAPTPARKPESISTRRGAAATGGMLMTPAKTPQRPPNEKVKAKVKSVARNLFHSDEEEVMPSPRKVRTQTDNPDSFYSGDAAETSFQIFTDSHERIPEVDNSVDNPFYVGPNPTTPEAPRRRSKRNTVSIPGEGKVPIDEAIRREDGMLIVFRGKKQFRKFTEMDEPSNRDGLDEGEGGLESAVESPTKRHFTRSSIKPRLLFPTADSDEPKELDEDEEAATDIEDHVLAGLEADKPETPADLVDETPGTPAAPRYAPASPPTTVRTTRFSNKKSAEPTPKPKQPTKRSPFDNWRRVKGGSQSAGQKRSGDDLSADAPKRTRA